MANPSLQIGNGKFAIKENDLLGYSSSGTRFFPIPITMTRATLGTRVNPSGLVENVELLGSEEVDCGNFECANPDGVWSTDLGWGISGGTATYDGSQGTKAISQSIANVQLGTFCKVTIDVLSNQGSGANTIFLGGTVLNNNHLDVGSYTFYGSFTTNTNLYIYGRSGEVFQIDNVSVKEVTRDGLARVDYTDGTGSLLVEPQRTNFIPYSEDFTSWYQIQNTNLTPNSTTSPSGDSDGTKFLSTSTGAKVRENFSAVSGTTYTFSVYCKNIDATLIKLLGYDGANEFNANLTSEVNTSTWTRISLTFTAANTGSGQIQIARDLPDTESAYFWGAQLEAGSYATSYIKTQGSSVTRNKDEYTKTGISNLINSEEGVLFAEIAALSDDLTDRYIMLSDGGWNNRIQLNYENVSNTIEARVFVGNLQQFDTSFVLTDITLNNKFAIKWKVNDFALWVNGVEVDTDSSGSVPSANTLNELSFKDGQGSNNFFGKVKQLQVFKTALTDTELATLTTQ